MVINERLHGVKPILNLKRKTNNDFILPSVYKALRLKPPVTSSLGGAVPLFNKEEALAAQHCCRPPTGLQEAGNKDDFHSLRQTGHTWVRLKTMCFQSFQHAVPCHALLLVSFEHTSIHFPDNSLQTFNHFWSLTFRSQQIHYSPDNF